MTTGSGLERHGSPVHATNKVVPHTEEENAAAVGQPAALPDEALQQPSSEIDRQPDAKPASFLVQFYHFLEEPESGPGAKFLSCSILITIMVSVVFLIAETIPDVKNGEAGSFLILWVEIFSTAIFTVEYVARFLVCGAGGQSKLQFVKTPTNVLDLLAILPFYLERAISSQGDTSVLRVLRSVRLLRIFRIFKLGKYSSGLHIMVESLRKSAEPLIILGFFLGIGVVLFSSLLFYVEKTSCPDIPALIAEGGFEAYRADCDREGSGWTKPFNTGLLCCNEYGSADDFKSIPATFWWSFATMSTVGYGDVYPRTSAGRLIGSVSMLCGILLISLPVAIVGSKFQDVYEEFEIKAEEEKDRRAEAKARESELQAERNDENRPDSSSSNSWRARLQRTVSFKKEGDRPGTGTSDGGRPGSSSQKSPKKDEGCQVEAVTEVTTIGSLKLPPERCIDSQEGPRKVSKTALEQVPALRGLLRGLQEKGLTEAAEEQIKQILSILDKVERLTTDSEALHVKDLELQQAIRKEVEAVSSVYSGSIGDAI